MIDIIWNGEVIDTVEDMETAEWMLAEYRCAFKEVEGERFSLSRRSRHAHFQQNINK